MDPKTAPPWMQGTMVGMALRACRKTLIEREEGDRMVVLGTDGYSFDLSGGNDEKIARELLRDGITVFIIHVADGDPPTEMGTIAGITGGEVFAAGDPAGLRKTFGRLDAMKAAKVKKTMAETQDNFGPLCEAGLATLGIFGLALLGLRVTPW